MRSSSFDVAPLVAIGVLLAATLHVGCAPERNSGASSDARLTETSTSNDLPVMHGDSAWLECDDGTLAVNLFEHQSPDGAGRVLAANLLLGENVLSGVIEESGNANLVDGPSAFTGTADVDFSKSTLALKGALSIFGSRSNVDKTLSCTSLGADFGEHGPAVPPVHGHGDSSWLVCDSQTLIANILEHRNATGDGRVTSVTLIVGGGRVVSGTLDDSGNAMLTGAGSSRDSFRGAVKIDFAGTPLSAALRGAYDLGGTSYDVDQNVACKQLFADAGS